MNKIIIHGRVVKKPELRYTQSQKPVTGFAVAVNDDYDREKAYFFDVVAWNKLAETAERYLDKGSEIVLSGRLTTRDWTDRDGGKRRAYEIIADSFDFCGRRESEASANRAVDVSTLEDTDGDLPF